MTLVPLLLFGLIARAAPAPRTVLFLCSGNFYRSRLAEAVFNHEATRAGLPWRARSRAVRRGPLKADQQRQRLSPFVRDHLAALDISLAHTAAEPGKATARDLREADCVIAMNEREHRALIERQFATARTRSIAYWHHEDKEVRPPGEVMPAIVTEVRRLVADLRAHRTPDGCR